MKIGIYDPYLDAMSGGEKYMLSAAYALSKMHDVTIFWDTDLFIPEAKKKFDLDLASVHVTRNIFMPRVSLLERLHLTRKYDVIIFLSDGSIPLVGSKKLFLHLQFPVEWVKHVSLINRLKLLRISKIICNSYFTKNFIDRRFGVKSVVVYPPSDIHFEGNVKKEEMILHVGRFATDEKGSDFKKQHVMIDVFKKMVDKGFTWKFVLVVGVREEYREKFEELKKASMGYPITFVESPENKELKKWYQKAKIYWHASGFGEDVVANPEKAEHFGISTVEAMAAGAVPIVINLGGQPEIVTNMENGILWNSLEELIENTEKVAKDTKLWEKLSKNAKQKARDFSEERFSHDITALVDAS